MRAIPKNKRPPVDGGLLLFRELRSKHEDQRSKAHLF